MIELPHVDVLVGAKGREEEMYDEALRLFRRGAEKIELFEITKSARDLQIISVVLDSIAVYLRQYGRSKDIEIPPDHIHILEEDGVRRYTEDRFEIGTQSTTLARVVADRRDDISFAITLFHEIWHGKVYNAIQVKPDGTLGVYRGGLTINSRDGETMWLYIVNEALTGLMTKRFYREVLSVHPVFADEVAKLTEPPDTTRMENVSSLNDLFDQIWKRNLARFEDVTGVVDLFIRADINGTLLPVARLLDNTFGRGSFWKFADDTKY